MAVVGSARARAQTMAVVAAVLGPAIGMRPLARGRAAVGGQTSSVNMTTKWGQPNFAPTECISTMQTLLPGITTSAIPVTKMVNIVKSLTTPRQLNDMPGGVRDFVHVERRH